MPTETKTITLKDFLTKFTDIEDLNYQNIIVEFTEENKDEIYKWLKEIIECNHMYVWENCIKYANAFYIENCDLHYVYVNEDFTSSWWFENYNWLKVV